MRVPWYARKSNQSILKEINPGYLLGGLMLKLKLQYFSHLMRRANSLKKTVMLGRIEGRQRSRQQRTRGLDGFSDLMDMSLSELRGTVKTQKPGVLQFMRARDSDMTEKLSNNQQFLSIVLSRYFN